ncbi:SDR family oxidoreductase [Methylotenera sp.]|uniref:SDR family oxidoreductase n=1 Tax=Methylotenera sp. TaxID=2051956 RepID=UPI0024877A39|nr:SDR family oxidoreductase [Methylotenera sp.]MDI1298001.1 SDR family oxidoreductase [Methylotenera sp.]
MNLHGKNIILTGAAGGIGQPLAFALSKRGARLALVDRDKARVYGLCNKINQLGGVAFPIVTDFKASEASPNPTQRVVDEAVHLLGSVDILINSAGILDFTLFQEQDAMRIAEMMHINAVVPLQLTRALLPKLLAQNGGQIVNIGSIFGSIGFPHYAAYSASKFAVHGFSQALRRELLDTNITVTYIAPRAIKTPMNDEVASKMLAATQTAMDEPQVVVEEIIKAIEADKQEHYIGQPESFFAWLNGFLPSVVSMGLKKPTRIARQFITPKN